jgi:signal transduction histidine kinase
VRTAQLAALGRPAVVESPLSRSGWEARRSSHLLSRVRPLLWPLGFAAGVGVVVPTLSTEGLEGLDATVILYVFVGWSFIGGGLVGWARRPENRIGALMVIVGFAWFLGALLTQSDSPLVFTLGVWVGDAWPILFVYLLLALPSGRLGSRLDRLVVGVFFFVLIPLEALWLLFLEALGEPGNAFLAWPNAAIADAIDTAQRAILLSAIAVVVAVLVRRWLYASAPLRRVMTPVLVGVAALLAYAVILAIDMVSRRSLFFDRVALVLFSAVAIAFLAALLRARLARSAVGDLLVELRETRAAGALRDAFARALHDPSLALAYWVPEYDTYVDVDGRPVALPVDGDGRVATLVERNGVRVAALVHDGALRDEPELVGAVTAAAGIALENERLQADLRARLEELRGSRARIVEAGDSERRRLERDLHDGAQQRLISLSVTLQLMACRLDAGSEAVELLDSARGDVAASLEELRELAHGIHPAVLADHGLDVALESLAARARLPVGLSVDVDERLPEAVEVAAYYLVSETLTNVAKYARAQAASVLVARRNRRLLVEVVDDGVGGADPVRGSGLRGLADRVEALDGRLRVWSPEGRGTRIRADIPCG